MRRLITILAVLTSAASGFLRAAEPGTVALALLTRMQDESVEVKEILKDTVISPYCGAARRKMIEWRMEGLARVVRDRGYEFEVLEEKQDGDFAAVLVAARNRTDPLDVDVFALGFGRKGEAWKPAPMPGTFDNVDLGFDEDLEGRVDALDLWMSAERVGRLRVLHDEAEAAFRRLLAAAVPQALLDTATPEEYVRSFLDACQKGNLPAAMRLISDFEDGLDEEDRKLQETLSRGLQGLDRRDNWRLLTSPEVVRVIVQEDPGDDLDAEVLMLLFDPEATDPTSLLRFVLLKVGKRWEIELPGSLRLSDESLLDFRRTVWQENDADDDEMTNRFEEFFEKQHEPTRAKDLQAAGRQIEKTLREGTLEDFFAHLHRSEDLSDLERRSAYRYLAEFWTNFHEINQSASDGELVEVLQEGGAAAMAIHLISTSQLEKVNLVSLLLIDGPDGWSIAPGVTTAGNYEKLPKERREAQDRVIATFNERKEDLSKAAAARFLKRFVAATPKKDGEVGKEEAAELVKTFRERLRKGDLLEAFECCALLDPKDGAWEALKSLSYEHRGARQAKVPDKFLMAASDKQWAAVSLRLDPGSGSVPVYPMYLVVATGQGPRIVVDVGLRLATNKGREILNQRVWKRIEQQLEQGETDLVRSLFEGHAEKSKNDLAEWEKSNK